MTTSCLFLLGNDRAKRIATYSMTCMFCLRPPRHAQYVQMSNTYARAGTTGRGDKLRRHRHLNSRSDTRSLAFPLRLVIMVTDTYFPSQDPGAAIVYTATCNPADLHTVIMVGHLKLQDNFSPWTLVSSPRYHPLQSRCHKFSSLFSQYRHW